MLIDTHCHIHNTEEFEHPADFFVQTPGKSYDSASILARAAANDVRKIIVIGTSHEDSLRARAFAEKYSTPELPIYWTYGIHPSEFEKSRAAAGFEAAPWAANPDPGVTPMPTNLDPGVTPRLATSDPGITPRSSPQPAPIAIGEVGLDYHYGPDAYGNPSISANEIKQNQFRLFEEMIALALKNSLPLSFHIREAFSDFFAILNNFSDTPIRGVVHCFTDNKKNLAKALDYGFYIGLDGNATYSTLPLPPLDRTLLETDSPFLAPVPHRHEINEPANIRNIAEWLAVQHHQSLAEIAARTTANARDLFGI